MDSPTRGGQGELGPGLLSTLVVTVLGLFSKAISAEVFSERATGDSSPSYLPLVSHFYDKERGQVG